MHKKNTSKQKQVTKRTSQLPQKSKQITSSTIRSRKQTSRQKNQQLVVLTTVVLILAATPLAIQLIITTGNTSLLICILQVATQLTIAIIKAMTQ